MYPQLTRMVLVLGTIGIVLLGLAIWRRIRDGTFVLGLAILYYFFVYGAWSILQVKRWEGSEDLASRVFHLEGEAFPINVDSAYLSAVALYCLFILIVEVVLLAGLRRAERVRAPEPISINLWLPLGMGWASGIAAFVLIRDDLLVAIATNTSPYLYTRANVSPTFVLFQIVDALLVLFCGWSVGLLLSRRRATVCRVQHVGWVQTAALVMLCVFTLAFEWVLGSRINLLVALFLGALLYLRNVPKVRWIRAGLSFWLLLGIVGIIEPVRATPITERMEFVRTRWPEILMTGFLGGGSSGESFAAHASLYGIIRYEVPPTYGSSLVALGASLVPRFLWADRPVDAYVRYSRSMGLPDDVGFTISHVAGWYLNFEVVGVIVGALILGAVWLACQRLSERLLLAHAPAWRVLGFVLPVSFAAGLAPLARAGPEGYKSMAMSVVVVWVVAAAGTIGTARAHESADETSG